MKYDGFVRGVVDRTLHGVVLDPDDALKATIRLANDAINVTLAWSRENRSANYYEAHAALYKSIRSGFPTLQSSLVQGCIEMATQIQKRHPGKANVKKPGSSIRLNARCFTPWMDSKRVGLVTVEGRRKYGFAARDDPPWLTPEARVKSVRIRLRGNRVEVDFCYTLPTPPATVPSDPVVVGVDMGIATPAVTHDGRFLGQNIRAHQRRYLYNRRVLQRKGTRSATRRLRAMRERERRYMRDQNHCIAKAIVADADVVVVEDLTHIRERVGTKGRRFNHRFHRWSYAERVALIEEKCEAQAKLLLKVDPTNTSKECSRCGNLKEDLGAAREYHCSPCGLWLNRDLNAARNISQRGKSLLGRLLVNQPHGRAYDGRFVFGHVAPDATSKPPTFSRW